jgi:O-phospho-L-seryl-tRNASec:L-selenocysteinyl-tRNA synthase
MNSDELSKSCQALGIPTTHATVGVSNLIAANKQYRSLFVNRRLPDHGWSDVQIQSLLFVFSILDTNNKTLATGGGGEDDAEESRWCGVGEREGRVYSALVAQRHFGLSHGIGRSGDITEPQPKAAGSSVLAKLTLLMVLDALRRGSGLDAKGAAANGIVLPLCTGMSMSLVLSSLRTDDTQRNIVLGGGGVGGRKKKYLNY